MWELDLHFVYIKFAFIFMSSLSNSFI